MQRRYPTFATRIAIMKANSAVAALLIVAAGATAAEGAPTSAAPERICSIVDEGTAFVVSSMQGGKTFEQMQHFINNSGVLDNVRAELGYSNASHYSALLMKVANVMNHAKRENIDAFYQMNATKVGKIFEENCLRELAAK